jgi:hypothetical protein
VDFRRDALINGVDRGRSSDVLAAVDLKVAAMLE